MNHFRKLPLATLLPLLIVGCGGGGVNLTDIPESTSPNNPAEPKKPEYKKGEAPDAGDFSVMGYSAAAPMKNLADPDVATKTFKVEDDNLTTYRDEDGDHISVNGKPVSVKLTAQGDSIQWSEVNNADSFINEDGIKFAYDPNTAVPMFKLSQYEYTRVGLLRLMQDDALLPTIFYRGTDKTTDTPTSGQATYDAHWEFAHQLHGQDDRNPEGGTGELSGTNKATFTADFGEKTLSGHLATSQDKASIDYNIDAKINGNTFSGTASGNYDFRGPNGQGNSSATVGGSFFGPQAAEIAGHLKADDKSFVAVFAGQQSQAENLKTDGDRYQASALRFQKVGDSDSYTIDEANKINFSGDVTKLQINGKLIALNAVESACCDSTQYMRFGKYSPEDAPELDTNYFVQGILTAQSDIPQTNKAEYAGHWSGYGEQADARFSGEKMDARFTATWADKTLTGKLYNANQSLDADPAISFSANIDGNHFSGETNSFSLAVDTDKGNLNNSAAITGTAAIDGHFYGEKANELGGSLRKEDGSFGGVFGAKQLK